MLYTNSNSNSFDFSSSIKPTGLEGDNIRAPVISSEEIEYGKKLASGTYGTVYEGYCRGKKVAIKKIAKPQDEKDIELIKNEMEILVHVRHPNVVLFMGVCLEDDDLIIVTELMQCDLFKYLKSEKIGILKKCHIALQIVEGMTWLHNSKPPILHSDLKPENVLINEEGNVKICDFGLSVITRGNSILRDGIVGTPLYMSPEALLQNKVTIKSDVFSFGVLFGSILTEHEPYPHIKTYKELLGAVVERQERQALPVDTPKSIVDIISQCCDMQPDNRPTFEVINKKICLALVDIAIHESTGSSFWIENFMNKFSVNFQIFSKQLCRFFSKSIEDYGLALQCYSAIVCGNEKVNIERFGRSICWFGPAHTEKDNILDRVLELFKHSWFFGVMDSLQAQARLHDIKKKGTYLIRCNDGPDANKFPFRITVTNGKKGGIVHYRVKNCNGDLHLKYKEGVIIGKDLADIVNQGKKKIELKVPCPGREFNQFFLDHKQAIYAIDLDSEDSDGNNKEQ